MSTAGLVFVALVSGFVCVLPCWPYSKRWGSGPACVLGALLLIFLYSLAVGDWDEK